MTGGFTMAHDAPELIFQWLSDNDNNDKNNSNDNNDSKHNLSSSLPREYARREVVLTVINNSHNYYCYY